MMSFVRFSSPLSLARNPGPFSFAGCFFAPTKGIFNQTFLKNPGFTSSILAAGGWAKLRISAKTIAFDAIAHPETRVGGGCVAVRVVGHVGLELPTDDVEGVDICSFHC